MLAVTDHCEVNRFFSLAHYGVEPNGYDTYDFGRDFELSMQENTAAKAHTPAGVKLLCGIELGQATHELALAEHVYADVRLDFVIGSMHQLPGWDDFAFLDYSKVDAAALFHENLQEIARLANTDTYDVLGHITYALRYMAAAGVHLELAPTGRNWRRSSGSSLPGARASRSTPPVCDRHTGIHSPIWNV